MDKDIFGAGEKSLSEYDKDFIFQMKSKAKELMDYFDNIKDSRELSLAITNLEQSVMWATKAYCNNDNLIEHTYLPSVE